MVKHITIIRLDEEIHQKAQELGLNVTKVCENAIKLSIEALTSVNKRIVDCPLADSNQSIPIPDIAGDSRAGFEPATTALQRRIAHSDLDWEAFEEYLGKQYRSKTARERFNYAKTFGHCLLDGNLSNLKTLTDDKKAHVLKGLSALAKYLGNYEEFKAMVRNYGITWAGRNKDDVVIERLTKVEDPQEVFKWIQEVKRARPEIADLMDLMAITGMRLVEAIESYNLIIRLSRIPRKQQLKEYYNVDAGVLEHFKFKETFIRNTKKVFISFVPQDLIERIQSNTEIASANSIIKTLQRNKIKSRFGDIREANGTFLTKHLQQPEIDFIHGRVATNVFMSNYFNPALIVDLKARAFQGIEEIREMIE